MATKRNDRDLAELAVLGLLSTGPRHTYEMQRFLVVAHKDFVTGLPRSLYHAVDRLAARGSIEPAGVTREPGRPERSNYRLTEPGRSELDRRIVSLLETPDRDGNLFIAALSSMAVLPPSTVAAALEARIDALTETETALRQAVAMENLPRVLLIESEYELSALVHQRAWVTALVDELKSGGLTWPDDPNRFDFPDGNPLERDEDELETAR
jgi:DNA-binding PadR family transcriptional regulator